MQQGPADQSTRFEIDAADDGDRLDRAVARWRGLSRSAVLQLLDGGGLSCNGRVLTRKDKGMVLRAGDVLSIEPRYLQGLLPMPNADLPLDVLAEGDGWVVVNKPAGMPVRPHGLDEQGAVLNALAARYPQVLGVGEGGLRSGVVHRLDNDTSGALLFALDPKRWTELREAFAQHRISKQYEALVYGDLPEAGASVLHLRVAQHSPAKVEVVDRPSAGDGSRACSLAWRVVERFGSTACRVSIDLHTGFLHQVRVMMSHLGHPVIGDAWYGPAEGAQIAARQMLHARSLVYESIRVEAPIPTDMIETAGRLKERSA